MLAFVGILFPQFGKKGCLEVILCPFLLWMVVLIVITFSGVFFVLVFCHLYFECKSQDMKDFSNRAL